MEVLLTCDMSQDPVAWGTKAWCDLKLQHRDDCVRGPLILQSFAMGPQ